MSCGGCVDCKCDRQPLEEKAIRQFTSKPSPTPSICACMGPQPLPGEEDKPYLEAKRTPVCGCAMQWVEEVDGYFYRVLPDYQGGHTATLLGPVGGPYLCDMYGRPV